MQLLSANSTEEAFVQAMVSPALLYGVECQAIKEGEEREAYGWCTFEDGYVQYKK